MEPITLNFLVPHQKLQQNVHHLQAYLREDTLKASHGDAWSHVSGYSYELFVKGIDDLMQIYFATMDLPDTERCMFPRIALRVEEAEVVLGYTKNIQIFLRYSTKKHFVLIVQFHDLEGWKSFTSTNPSMKAFDLLMVLFEPIFGWLDSEIYEDDILQHHPFDLGCHVAYVGDALFNDLEQPGQEAIQKYGQRVNETGFFLFRDADFHLSGNERWDRMEEIRMWIQPSKYRL